MFGTIIKVKDPGGFGFIAQANGGPNVFFHFSALDGLEFGEQLLELNVEFETVGSDRGPRASFVRAAD